MADVAVSSLKSFGWIFLGAFVAGVLAVLLDRAGVRRFEQQVVSSIS
jgi:hypothetical protein